MVVVGPSYLKTTPKAPFLSSQVAHRTFTSLNLYRQTARPGWPPPPQLDKGGVEEIPSTDIRESLSPHNKLQILEVLSDV